MDWAGVVVGAVAGLAVSLGLWWVQFRVIVPRLRFASGISKLMSADGEPSYRLKLENAGRRRGIIDLTVDVRVFLGTGLLDYEGDVKLMRTSTSLRVRSTVDDGIMRLGPGQNRIVRLDLRQTSWPNTNPRLLRAAGIDPESETTIELEALLQVARDGYLRVRVLAYDEFSGSRTYFESPRYHLDDVAAGRFVGMTVRALPPDEPEASPG